MSTKNRFNLIDEAWIPIVSVGRVSLRQVFSNSNYKALGGNPIQKIALTKLLLAITQAAYTPIDDNDWATLGAEGLAKRCLGYLEKWYDRFWLYGEKPFLQMPQISKATLQNYGAVIPEVATGNTTILTNLQQERELSDAEKAVLLTTLMGCSLGGKKTDNKIVLSEGYRGKLNEKGKVSSSKPGSSIGFRGFLHSFLQGDSLQETVWFNQFTETTIRKLSFYPNGIGVAPWENMPAGEECEVAVSLKKSLMGRLISLSRFCLLTEAGLHYSEGILHPDYEEGVIDPSVSVNFHNKKPTVIWTDPEKRPWRYLIALLQAALQGGSSDNFECYQIRYGLSRARQQSGRVGIWSGGLRASNNAGEQYISGNDDFVESILMLKSNWIGESWYLQLVSEMNALDRLSKTVEYRTKEFFKTQEMDGSKQARMASHLYWQLCERHVYELFEVCGEEKSEKNLRKIFAACAYKAYDSFCPKDTVRQLEAWAKCCPNLHYYLN